MRGARCELRVTRCEVQAATSCELQAAKSDADDFHRLLYVDESVVSFFVLECGHGICGGPADMHRACRQVPRKKRDQKLGSITSQHFEYQNQGRSSPGELSEHPR